MVMHLTPFPQPTPEGDNTTVENWKTNKKARRPWQAGNACPARGARILTLFLTPSPPPKRGEGYPPDKQETATQTVLEQAKLLCVAWAV